METALETQNLQRAMSSDSSMDDGNPSPLAHRPSQEGSDSSMDDGNFKTAKNTMPISSFRFLWTMETTKNPHFYLWKVQPLWNGKTR